MIINHAVLHILDFHSDICVFSQKEMDLKNAAVVSFIEKHIQRIFKDNKCQTGIFKSESWFLDALTQYCKSQVELIDFSNKIANILHDSISISDKRSSLDILVLDFDNDTESYFAILLIECKRAFTHQVINQGGVVENSIIEHYAILPNANQKIDSFAIIKKDSRAILLSDKRRYIEGQDVFVISERLLQCSTEISSGDALKAVNTIITKVAEQHGENAAVVLSKAKNYIMENSEISATLSPVELGKELFADSEELQDAFESMVEEAQIPSKVEVPKNLAIKTGKNHRIRTDTGIEITFPAEYFENHEFIEFINNANGTISIQLKNIGKIINR